MHPAVALRVITGSLRRHPAPPPAPAGGEAGPRIAEVPTSLSSR
jgi:hypothetical protein